MARVLIPQNASYQSRFQRKWLTMREMYEKDVGNYVSLATSPRVWEGYEKPDGTFDAIIVHIDIAFIGNGWDLAQWGGSVLRGSLALPNDLHLFPTYVQLFDDGGIQYQKDYRWGEDEWFIKTLKSLWENPALGIFFAGMIWGELKNIGVIQSLIELYNWFQKQATYLREEALRKYYHAVYYTSDFLEPYLSPIVNFNNQIVKPFIGTVNTAISTINATIATVQADIKTVSDAVLGPLEQVRKAIQDPTSSAHQTFLKIIDPAARLFAEFGIDSLQKFETKGNRYFDEIFDYVEDKDTQYKKPVLKLQNRLDSYIVDTYAPIKKRSELVSRYIAEPTLENAVRLIPTIANVMPYIDAVMEIEEGVALIDAKLRGTALQKTLERNQATVMISSAENEPIRKKLPYTPLPVVEGHLPVGEYWWKLLEMEGQNLYVDDKGQPLAPVMGKDGKYTVDKGNLRGRVYPVTDAVSYKNADPLADIEARILLYERCLLVSEVTAYYLSWDPWVRIGEWAMKDLTNTMFYSGSVGARVAEYIIPGLAPVDYTPEELIEQAKLQDAWLIKEFHVLEQETLKAAALNKYILTHYPPMH